MTDFMKPNTDLALAHPLLRIRWQTLAKELAAAGLRTIIVECFRSDERQAWLYGQGRTPAELEAVGVDPLFARAGDRVTNAYSAALSAHGWRDDWGQPASCALDLVPVGKDGKPWTADDPWGAFVEAVANSKSGLRHFSKQGKPPWDKPHVQLREWNDAQHRLVILPNG